MDRRDQVDQSENQDRLDQRDHWGQLEMLEREEPLELEVRWVQPDLLVQLVQSGRPGQQEPRAREAQQGHPVHVESVDQRAQLGSRACRVQQAPLDLQEQLEREDYGVQVEHQVKMDHLDYRVKWAQEVQLVLLASEEPRVRVDCLDHLGQPAQGAKMGSQEDLDQVDHPAMSV